MLRYTVIVLAVVAILLLGGGILGYLVLTGAFTGMDREVAAGEPLPDFTMPATDGETHSLGDYEGQIVVLDFCSHLCPWSAAVDTQLAELHEQYAEEDVVFLGIDSHYDVDLEEIEAYVEESGKPYPVLKDENHAYADRMGVRVTPEILVADTEGRLVYQGAFDNRIVPDNAGSVNYLEETLDALLAGEPVPRESTSAWGCTIKRGE
ncbi:MAG: redoxin domain-containing protein [Candidatus Hydrogenedentota bacterium]